MDQAWSKPTDGRLRLKPGTVLGGEFIVESELGAGGFGITYLGRDQRLGRTVAIKEYFPADVGTRDSSLSVRPLSSSQDRVFHWGLDKFIREAQMLAAFKHPGIVTVLRYFEENLTAYMVLDFIEGKTVGRWLDGLGRRPSQAELDRIVGELCDALQVIHGKEIIHRDIAPDNIIIRPNGSAVLLDFGAARQDLAIEQVTAGSGSLLSHTYAIVKRHYSPVEAYSVEKSKRGTWSDVYSLAAVLYRAVTGTPPPDAMERAGRDPLVPALVAASGRYRKSFLAAIDGALTVAREDRIATIGAFRELALAPSSEPRPVGDGPAGPRLSTGSGGGPATEVIDQEPRPRSSLMPQLAAIAAVLTLVAGLAVFLLNRGGPPGPPSPPDPGSGLRMHFADARQELDLVIGRLRQALSEGRKAGLDRQWSRLRTMTADAEKFVEDARRAITRLRAAAATESEQRMATDLLGEMDVLERQVADMRRSADEAERTAERDLIERISRFIDLTFHGIRNGETFDYSQIYDNRVDFFGEVLTLDEVAAKKREFFRSRKNTLYALIPGRMSLSPAKDGHRVIFESTFRVEADNEERSGRFSTELVLREISPGHFRVTFERSAVLEMHKRPLSPGDGPVPSVPPKILPPAKTGLPEAKSPAAVPLDAPVSPAAPATPALPPKSRTWITHRGRWVEGNSYLRLKLGDFGLCGQMCAADPRCRMFVIARDDVTKTRACGLYDHAHVAPTPGKSTVGVMRD